jgi:hypothetical protein
MLALIQLPVDFHLHKDAYDVCFGSAVASAIPRLTRLAAAAGGARRTNQKQHVA